MTTRALLAVAHGSPDERAEPVLEALVARVRAERAWMPTALAHLGHSRPDVPTAVASLVAQGVSEIVVVPLLLTSAYHAKVDLPALLAQARTDHAGLMLTQTGVLGPHPLLFDLLRRRLREAGADSAASVVIGAIGTSDAGANAELADVAATMGATIGLATGSPDIADVVDDLRARGARQIAIASYVLAPGTLPDRFAATTADVITRVLGAEPEVVEIILQRFDASVAAREAV